LKRYYHTQIRNIRIECVPFLRPTQERATTQEFISAQHVIGIKAKMATSIQVSLIGVTKKITFYLGTSSEDIRSTLRSAFSLSPSSDITLFDASHEIVVLSSTIPAGEYSLGVQGMEGIDTTIKLDETQRKLMLESKPYESWDPLLCRDRALARHKLYRFNNCLDRKLRNDILIKDILHPESSKDAFFEPPFHVDYGYNITVGEDFYANFGCIILDCAPITIGNHVKFGPGVHIYAATHPLDSEERRKREYALPVKIGDDVWIGGGVKVLPGVTIGNKCVIGSGSVVTKGI